MKRTASAVALLGLVVLAGCSKSTSEEPMRPGDSREPSSGAAALTVTSTGFTEGNTIPARFTCEGDDVSPPLAWSNPPDGTKSFAVVVEDPDVPDLRARKDTTKTLVHWVVYNLPPSALSLPEATTTLPTGGREGVNDFGRSGYRGPCPPSGKHRYIFTVYALDTVLPDLGNPSRAELDRAMNGHVLARGQLVGTHATGREPRTT